jgi:ankyrin repeat protein
MGGLAAAGLCAQSAVPDIFQAAASGDVKRATELLDAQPELVRARSEDRTPLHVAARAGKPEMVIFLLARGAELSVGPESPLIVAVDWPDHEVAFAMAQPLINNASDLNARSRDGRTVMEIAKSRRHTELVEWLKHRELAWYGRRPKADSDLNGLAWPLVNRFVSISHGDFEKVKQMMGDEPGLLNVRASWDELPVEAASHTGQTPIAEWLAAKGAMVSTCTATLLGLADRVKAAIAADARCVRERGAHDIAIMAYTAYGKEQTAIAEMLLKAGADVNGLALNVTTLHVAASKGYVDLGTLLIERGADVNLVAKTQRGMVTALDVAVRQKQEGMEKLLRSKGAR